MKCNTIIIISIISFFLVSCIHVDDSPVSIGYYYVNYKDTNITVKENWFVSDNISSCNREMRYIDDICFNSWLNDNDFLNGWMSYNMYKNSNTCNWLKGRGYEVDEPIEGMTRIEYLEGQNDSIEYYYLGRVYVSSSFDSYLIDRISLARDTNSFYDRITYMFNIRNHCLLSIVATHHYYSYSGIGDSRYSYTTHVSPNTYKYLSVQLGSDNISEDKDMSRKQELPEELFSYTIDRDGYLTNVSMPLAE